jgi:protein-tyrosine phosphatase
MKSTLFRQVRLPEEIPGKLYLHSMPGRYEPFDQFQQEATCLGIQRLVCLTSQEEIRQKSPDFLTALREGELKLTISPFPIEDFGVPEDQPAFQQFSGQIAERLKEGKTCLVHCGAGIGRTGTMAIAILLSLGLSFTEAASSVKNAGSYPETPEQLHLLTWLADRLKQIEDGMAGLG